MAQSAELLQRAVAQHQAGQVREAEALYLLVLAAEPQNADAHHLLGLACFAQGEHVRAIDAMQKAVALDAHSASFQHDLGVAQQAAGRDADAEASYREAIRLDPQMIAAYNNLGNLLQEQRKWAAALDAFRIAVGLRPDIAELHFNLGNCCRAQERWDEAAASYRQAIAHKPELAAAHTNLGSVLQSQKKYTEAAACHREALGWNPQLAAAHTGLGTALQTLGQRADAKAAYLRALEISPTDPTAHYNLGTVLMAEGDLHAAEIHFQKVTDGSPDYAEAHFLLGQCLHLNRKLDEAVASFGRAIALEPAEPKYHFWEAQSHMLMSNYEASLERLDEVLRLRPGDAEAHVCRGMILMAQGRLLEGARENEHRFGVPESAGRPFPQPRWNGSPLEGKTILIESEGGLGDTLHYIRYHALVVERGGRPIVEVQRPLVPLLKESGFAGILERGDTLPTFDVHVRTMSLPAVFETTLETIPAAVPYLSASPALVEQWRARLADVEGLKVGIHWQGSPTFDMDPYRSVPLAEFAPLAAVPGVRLISLQKGPGEDQIAALGGRFPVIELEGLDEAHGAFMDSAAVIENLDLVITSDSAVAHLAGALGARVWLVLAKVAECRWLLDRDDSPWYPTMRLFRQATLGDWPPVFARVAAELAEVASRHTEPTS